MVEQRYQAVLAVIGQGETVKDVAARWGVARQTLHRWLARYQAGGLDGLGDGSHRPRGCPHQMPAEVEAAVLETRRRHVSWGPRRIVYELARQGVRPAAERVRGGVTRSPARGRALLCEAPRPADSRRRRRRERADPAGLRRAARRAGAARGSRADPHRQRQGVHRQVRRPPQRGAVRPDLPRERHRAPPHRPALADHHRQGRAVPQDLARGVRHRPGVLLADGGPGRPQRMGRLLQQRAAAPDDRHGPTGRAVQQPRPAAAEPTRPAGPTRGTRPGQHWVARRVASNGIVSVDWQQVSVGKHRAGARCDVLVTDQLLQFWIGDELMKTVPRTRTGEVRKKRASVRREQQ